MVCEKLKNILGPEVSQNNDTMFHLIARSNNWDMLERIWMWINREELKDILQARNNDGDTCLHTAIKNLNGDLAECMMSQLFDLGADINAQDQLGNTVLHLAVDQHDFEVAEWLISVCADKSIKNNNSLTPYELAVHKNDQKMMMLLLK